MTTDGRGLTLTSAVPAARAAYDVGVDSLLGWRQDAMARFEEAIGHDPGLALAHAGAAICHFLEERFPEARAAAETATTTAAGQTARERSHVEGVAHLVGGRLPEAERVMREHLDRHPRDLIVLQRLYFVWFWQGRFPEMLALTTALLPAQDGDGYARGLHAFALEEGDHLLEAIRVAETALEENPRDAWGVHALAHALFELGVFDRGIASLPPAIHPCTGLNWFRNHLLWHLALLHLAAGDAERASALARTVFERAPSAIAGDLHDSISLLWRLELAGTPMGDRWRPFAAIARERLGRQALLFHAAHLAMALAAGGDWATAERQLELLRERAPRDRTRLVGEVLLPLAEGLHAFVQGAYPRCIERIEPIGPRFVQLGGSRAQRDVFHDTLLEACFRAGDAERAGRLLALRIARRPDRQWVARRVVTEHRGGGGPPSRFPPGTLQPRGPGPDWTPSA